MNDRKRAGQQAAWLGAGYGERKNWQIHQRKKNKTWNDAAAVSGSDTGNGESGVQMGNRKLWQGTS